MTKTVEHTETEKVKRPRPITEITLLAAQLAQGKAKVAVGRLEERIAKLQERQAAFEALEKQEAELAEELNKADGALAAATNHVADIERALHAKK